MRTICLSMLFLMFLGCTEKKEKYEYAPLKYRKACVEESFIPVDISILYNEEHIKNGVLNDQIQNLKRKIRWCNSIYGDVNSTVNNFTLNISEKKQLEKIESDVTNHKLNKCVDSTLKKLNLEKGVLNKSGKILIKLTWGTANWRKYISALDSNDFGKALHHLDLIEKNHRDLSDYLAIAIQKGKNKIAKKIIKKGISPSDTVGPNKMPLVQCAVLNGEEEILQLLLEKGANLNSLQLKKYLRNLKENCKKEPKFPATGNGCFPEIIKKLEEYQKQQEV